MKFMHIQYRFVPHFQVQVLVKPEKFNNMLGKENKENNGS